MNLTDIKSPAAIRSLSIDDLDTLADELRRELLEKLASHGGHAGPNLGFVEPTIALHYVFDTPRDKIVFDVSHQTYVHKMLTGRIEAFMSPGHYDDVTGYTNPKESRYDLFSVGHTSTSLGLASGLAKARDMTGGTENVVAVIGDGSLSGGQAFEGLDYAGDLNSNFIVVVNDNQMSIAPNHGSLYDNLALLRESGGTAACNYFRSLGFDYIYVPCGNDLRQLIDAFRSVKDTTHPVVVHINTLKGKGYNPAEQNKESFHYSSPFDLSTGEKATPRESYTDIFAEHMLSRMSSDPRVAVITAGVPGAIGFTPERRERAGSRFIDVGIAEEHAVSMSSGMAAGGCRPVVAEPASFIQRTYDQISQDVCINGAPTAFVTFYGGVWGMNDATHLGFFDVPMISNIPGLLFLEATCREEYLAMLDYAIDRTDGPTVVRTPSGAVVSRPGNYDVDYATAGYEVVRPGSDIAIIGVGDFLPLAMQAAGIMAAAGKDPMVINPRCVSRPDTGTLDTLRGFKTVITLEDNSIDGGFGQKAASWLSGSGVAVHALGLPKAFPDRFRAAELLASCGLTPEAIAALAD